MYTKNLTLYIALALSAATALMYEVVASKILFYFFSESTYSVSTVLSTFLLGLAIGSFLYYKFQSKITCQRQLFGLSQLLIGVYGFFVFTHIADIVQDIHTFGLFVVSVLLLLIPTIALGVIFPLTLTLVGDDTKNGLIYFIDLVGAAAGSLLAGFYLIPTLGNTFTVYVAVGMSFLAAFLVLDKQGKLMVVLLTTLGYIFISQTDVTETVSEQNIYFNKPSPYGEIILENKTLYIDGRDQCSWAYPGDASERKIVDYVFENIAVPDARVLNIGLGCGLTLSAILTKTTAPVDVVEINPVVVEVNRLQSTLLEDPNINLINDEGLNYLRNDNTKYDAIVIDIEEPAVIHASDLYTVEAFEEIEKSLVDGGVFGLWVNRCKNEEYSDIIYNTLHRVFTHVYQVHDNIFIASDSILPYNTYVPFTESLSINSVDHKRLAKVYFDDCKFGKESQHYLDL